MCRRSSVTLITVYLGRVTAALYSLLAQYGQGTSLAGLSMLDGLLTSKGENGAQAGSGVSVSEKVEGELWDQAKHGKWGPKIIYLVTSELLLVISQSLPLSFRFLIVVSNTNLSRNASCNQRIRSLAPFHPDTDGD